MKIKDVSLIGAGTAFEIYDSYILGFMLDIINKNFFPESMHGKLVSIAAFSILFIIRPISAVFWGILGDKYGKILVFRHSILFMAIATFLIGLLPIYQDIGMLAPILLLSLRVIQGISISGEFGSAVVLCYEQSSKDQRFSTNGLLYMFIFGGILIASAMTYIVYHSNIPANLSWRIPFIFGGSCGFIIYFIRRRLNLTEKKHQHVSLKLVFQNYKSLLISICAIFIINLNWMYFSSIASILGEHLNTNSINKLSLSCSLVVLSIAFIFGKYIARHIKHKIITVLYISIILMYLIGFFLTNYINIAKAMIIFYYIEATIAGVIFVSIPILIIDHLLPEIHNSIYNIANNISTAIIVGLMPFIINILIHTYNNNWINYFFTINLIISLISLLSIKLFCEK